jgi:lipopolysaccharide biosynthesis protein
LRLALYAHYSATGEIALYVLFYLRKLRELGFRVCFISNSPIPQRKEPELHEICERVIERGNAGYDFAMWQLAIAEYDVAHLDELLLTNSSIVGPLHPLEPFWRHPASGQCDFWGLTDNDEYGRHLQSYFILFRRQVLEHPCFREFWRSILPFSDRQIIIQSYEVGLTGWLVQHGFRWGVKFPQEDLHCLWLSRRRFTEKLKDRIRPLKLPQNTPMLLPDLLLECGMPFLKAKLLSGGGNPRLQVGSEVARRLLEGSNIPADILNELRMASA